MTVSKDHVIKRQGKEFILYVGLLAEAHERGLVGIKTTLIQIPTAENGHVAIVHATAEMKDGRTFDGIGDADFVNVGPNIKPHIIRMAETRAKARAMRDATNIGITAFEELGGGDEDEAHAPTPETTARQNGRSNPSPRGTIPQRGSGTRLDTETGEVQQVFADTPNASPYKPASANQLATASKLARLLGYPEESGMEDWTSADASERITKLSHEYNQRKEAVR